MESIIKMQLLQMKLLMYNIVRKNYVAQPIYVLLTFGCLKNRSFSEGFTNEIALRFFFEINKCPW